MIKLIKRLIAWIRYKRIIKALNLKDRKELRDYALLKTAELIPGRRTGKTISVIVKTLVHRKEPLNLPRLSDYSSYSTNMFGIKARYNSPMREDPDYSCNGMKTQKWHNQTLYACWRRCKDKGIHVFEFIV